MLSLSSGKIDKHEYVTGEEKLSSYQSLVIKQGNLHVHLSGKHQKNKQRHKLMV